MYVYKKYGQREGDILRFMSSQLVKKNSKIVLQNFSC